MQLMKLRSKTVELYAVADNFAVFQELAPELDEEFEDGRWATIDFNEFNKMLVSGIPAGLENVLIGVDAPDEGRIPEIASFVVQAKRAGLPVVLLVKDISPAAMHQLLRAGADDFLPYPAPEGALFETLSRVREEGGGFGGAAATGGAGAGRRGTILPVYSVSGGSGGSTFAVNLAWELALATRKKNKRVCILDFNFQYGAVSTYLDLPRLESIFELLSDPENMDADALASALTSYNKRLAVLTAPNDSLPYDIVGPDDIQKLLRIAQQSYDFVIVDMPQALTLWTETVLMASERFFVLMEMDMRSAQNMLRFIRGLKAEDLPLEKLEFLLNRMPGGLDLSAKSRVKKMAESLGIEYSFTLPDGGKSVAQACDHGAPLAEYASGNALRKEIRKIAKTVEESVEAAGAAIA